MRQAMMRHTSGEARVIPIILRPVYWQQTPFGKLQAFPKDAQPVVSPYWHSQDDAFFNVAEGIRQVVVELISSLQQTAREKEANEAERRKHLDAMTAIYQGLQLTCMLLEYAVDIEVKRDEELATKMLGDLEKLRELLLEEIEKYRLLFSAEEIVGSRERTRYYQKMYSQLSDAALAVNRKYFSLPQRQQGPEYFCTEEACREAALNEARKFPPSLYGIVEG